jgi:dihydroorotase (multifunctional complex type)
MLLIRRASVIGPRGLEPADILIVKERIAEVAPELTLPANAETVEAHGWLALPGLIDIHVHLREPGAEHKEDIFTGTQSALAGGVTTVLVMPDTSPPIVDDASLQPVLDLAARKAVCDFGYYVAATPGNVQTAAGVQGAVGLQMYMGSIGGSMLVEHFADQYAHLENYAADRVVAVHAENEEAVAYFASRGQRRPPVCAGIETSRAIQMARALKRSVHFCHVSTAEEMRMIKEARERGEPVTCEVTPSHLFLSAEVEQHFGALTYTNPPLRSAADVVVLWDQLDHIDAIASAHAPHTLEEKNGPQPPAGAPGLETMLPLLLTAVRQKQLGLNDLVRLTASGPARLFGLERKGRLAPGYDADIVLVDPDAQWTIEGTRLFTRCGWTPFESWRVWGQVRQVYLRGQLAFDAGRVLAKPGAGRQVRQVISSAHHPN